MIATVVHVRTSATTWRCLADSERTSSSVSRALASMREVIRSRSHCARRVSSIAPRTSRTITSRLLRAHRLRSVNAALAPVTEILLCHHIPFTGILGGQPTPGLVPAHPRLGGQPTPAWWPAHPRATASPLRPRPGETLARPAQPFYKLLAEPRAPADSPAHFAS